MHVYDNISYIYYWLVLSCSVRCCNDGCTSWHLPLSRCRWAYCDNTCSLYPLHHTPIVPPHYTVVCNRVFSFYHCYLLCTLHKSIPSENIYWIQPEQWLVRTARNKYAPVHHTRCWGRNNLAFHRLSLLITHVCLIQAHPGFVTNNNCVIQSSQACSIVTITQKVSTRCHWVLFKGSLYYIILIMKSRNYSTVKI